MYREVSATAKKKLVRQQRLASEPIKVPSMSGSRFDTRYLLDALVGRSNVLKAYGLSYVVIKGVAVPTRLLREWLTLFCQDVSGDKTNIHAWSPEDWVYVHRGIEKDKDKSNYGKRILILHFVSEEETIDVTTTFVNQFDNLELNSEGGYKNSPVFHRVVFWRAHD